MSGETWVESQDVDCTPSGSGLYLLHRDPTQITHSISGTRHVQNSGENALTNLEVAPYLRTISGAHVPNEKKALSSVPVPDTDTSFRGRLHIAVSQLATRAHIFDECFGRRVHTVCTWATLRNNRLGRDRNLLTFASYALSIIHTSSGTCMKYAAILMPGQMLSMAQFSPA
ncbi:hypothetical protein SERLA73DRAFT_72651 [Serpula lacrymans var. lacrymans S7.3]|uniref:Uncharacterized protein n=1 Tax=Serpula lacrymans var. lacrymans (strain S7.3) TaxID=936435 RepID=F8PW09_SERL3|nr:hypothetical protein SERLA73DRAFT_72651 [Serpula lacrymans var. lacrymans S7.3]